MRFSIIFPSRERIPLLTDLLESIKNNTQLLHEVEVLVYIDQDDSDSYLFLRKATCMKIYPFMRYFSGVRSEPPNFSRDYYNYLAAQSTGRWIIACNDDCKFETSGWDVLAYDVLKDKPNVIYGWSEDHLGGNRAPGHGNYCCFPLIGRKGYEALGYYFPERIPTWGCDIWIKGLYDQIGSNVILPMTIRHFTSHNGSRAMDHINRRIATRQVKYSVYPQYDEINILLKALQEDQKLVGAK